MDRVNRTAEFNISIGATDCWGKGYGTETTQLMLTYAFDMLGFHAIWLRVIGTNERAIRAYRRAGFQEAGRLREAHRVGQQAYDLVTACSCLYGCPACVGPILAAGESDGPTPKEAARLVLALLTGESSDGA